MNWSRILWNAPDHAYRGGTTLRMLATTLFSSVDLQRGCNYATTLANDLKISSADNYEVSIQTPSDLPRARC